MNQKFLKYFKNLFVLIFIVKNLMGEVIVYQWKENNNEQSLSDLILKIQDDSKKLKKTLEVFIPSKISGTSLSGILDILDFLNYSKINKRIQLKIHLII